MQYATFPIPDNYPNYLGHRLIEIQSEWVADLLQGRAILPAEPQMNREIVRYHAATAKRYTRLGRHAIQVDFLAYLREIRRERQAGARRSADALEAAAAVSWRGRHAGAPTRDRRPAGACR
jgi:hypothetical protein